MPTARNLLTSLVAGAPPDPDLAFQISLLDIEYHTILGNLDVASERISDLESSVKHEDADVYQQLHLMILEAMLFAKVGIPEKGFSIIVRAAAVSYRARIVPSLWESVGALANILISLKEWDAARMVLDSIIPQVCVGNSLKKTKNETDDYSLIGNCRWRHGVVRSVVLMACRCTRRSCRERS